MSVWDHLVGQDHVIDVFTRAAATARDIAEGSVTPESVHSMTHAWLVTGPPGSGRSVAAMAFASALQCTGETVGCGTCPGCVTTQSRSNADVLVLKTDMTIISVQEVRNIIARAQVAPSQGRWRVILIEDADRIQDVSLNILLKAIEEPPERTVWVLCAPSPEDIIATVRSRCRQVSLRVPSVEAVADLLMATEGVDRSVALEATRSAQCHIGLARALVRDPDLRARRRAVIQAPIQVRTVAEAVCAAQDLLDMAKEQAKLTTTERNADDQADAMRQLGLGEGDKIPLALRTHLRAASQDQERREKRSLTDALDRALLDLMGIYRDVLMIQLDAGQKLLNEDLSPLVSELARQLSTNGTVLRMDAIERARSRLLSNANTLLTLESLVLSLRVCEKNDETPVHMGGAGGR